VSRVRHWSQIENANPPSAEDLFVAGAAAAAREAAQRRVAQVREFAIDDAIDTAWTQDRMGAESIAAGAAAAVREKLSACITPRVFNETTAGLDAMLSVGTWRPGVGVVIEAADAAAVAAADVAVSAAAEIVIDATIFATEELDEDQGSIRDATIRAATEASRSVWRQTYDAMLVRATKEWLPLFAGRAVTVNLLAIN
jgi:hypothetical protein